MNPIERKILKAGGIVLHKPLFCADGTENKAGIDALFSALDSGWSRCSVCQQQFLNDGPPKKCAFANCPFIGIR